MAADGASPPRISVVICTYSDDRLPQVLDAVRSVVEGSTAALETILVCDHNAGLEQVLRARAPGCVVIANTEPRGLSGARNTGAKAARAPVVAFLDDDAVASEGWLAELAAPFTDPRVAVVGGRVDPLWLGPRPDWFPDEFGWVVGFSQTGVPTTTAVVRNPFGGNMAIRRDELLAIGGFRSGVGRVGEVPVGGEETDVCIRLKVALPDALVIFEPRAHIAHRVPASRATARYFLSRCWHEGISKAQLALHSGAGRALSEERRHVTRVLPRAVARGLRDAVRGDVRGGGGRAAAVVAGVATAAAGYGSHLVRERRRP